MKGKVLRKHSLHEKKAASILLKLFIIGNEGCHTTDALALVYADCKCRYSWCILNLSR